MAFGLQLVAQELTNWVFSWTKGPKSAKIENKKWESFADKFAQDKNQYTSKINSQLPLPHPHPSALLHRASVEYVCANCMCLTLLTSVLWIDGSLGIHSNSVWVILNLRRRGQQQAVADYGYVVSVWLAQSITEASDDHPVEWNVSETVGTNWFGTPNLGGHILRQPIFATDWVGKWRHESNLCHNTIEEKQGRVLLRVDY